MRKYDRPAGGKLELNVGFILHSERGKVKLEDALVYVHVEGYARGRVTDLFLEFLFLGISQQSCLHSGLL